MGNTKRKIADGLQEMLHVKPLRKITVQDIMDCKDMKRQSFYYHFQDIYGVIEWIFHEDFVKQVAYTRRFPSFPAQNRWRSCPSTTGTSRSISRSLLIFSCTFR